MARPIGTPRASITEVVAAAIRGYARFMLRYSQLATWPLLLVAVACSAKDAVSLSADVPSAQISVKKSVFTSAGEAPRGTASGTFELLLKLGPEASGSTTVELQSFALDTQAGQSLADPLPVTSDAQFPLVVDKGQSKTLHFTVTATDVDYDASCAGPLSIIGSVSDSLRGAADPLQSLPINPSCDGS